MPNTEQNEHTIPERTLFHDFYLHSIEDAMAKGLALGCAAGLFSMDEAKRFSDAHDRALRYLLKIK